MLTVVLKGEWNASGRLHFHLRCPKNIDLMNKLFRGCYFWSRATLLSFVLLGVIACGGGGGGGGGGSSDPVPVPVTPAAPVIAQQPASQTVQATLPVTFTVIAQNPLGVSYQWFRNGTAVNGATQASHTIAMAALQDSGSRWSVRLANDGGTVTSAEAVLTVTPLPIPLGLSLTAGGAWGPGNLDGKGREAYFNRPAGIAFDASGTAYLADSGNRTIRKVTADGTVSTLAGLPGISGSQDGIGSQALFESPLDMAVTTDGQIYVLDSIKLRRVSPEGAVTTVSLPSNVIAGAIAAGADGALYLSSRSAVYRVVPAGIVPAGPTLTLIAGQEGVSGSTDAAGANATFLYIQDIAVDAARNIYVSQPRTIRKITPDGTVTTFAGVVSAFGSVDGNGSAARFSSPAGLALDSGGNLWVAELDSGRFRKISPAGDVTTPYGRDRPFFSSNNPPRVPIAVGPSGDLYFSVGLGISRINAAGVLTPVAGQDFPAEQGIGDVRGLGVDPAGNVVVGSFVLTQTSTSTGASIRLDKFTPGGERLPFQVAVPVGTQPFAATVDAQGNIYVSWVTSKSVTFLLAPTGGSISKISPDGVVSSVAAWTEDSPNRFAPGFMTLGRDGAFYFVDLLTGNLVKWTAVAGPSVLARVGNPTFNLEPGVTRWILAADAAGKVYVVTNGMVQTVDNGVLTTLAGEAGQFGTTDGTGAQARFAAPASAVLDAAGNLYVGDREVVRKVAPGGVVTTVAGQPGKIGLRPGALPGSLGTIGSMAMAPDGVLHLISSNALVKIRFQ